MPIEVRDGTGTDIPFLREMLYEAVYWRSILRKENPPLEEGLAAPGVCNALDDWGKRGDTAVICVEDSIAAGAAWYRFYNETNAIRGYVNESTPVVVIAVASQHRRRGIGMALMTALFERASEQGVQRLSLMVSGDNHAITLYEKSGFRVSAREGDSYVMIREI